MSSFTVWLLQPRGFCRGVERAIEVAEIVALIIEPDSAYVKHAIVHNRQVVSVLEQRGIIFVERMSDVPEGATAIASAHGSPRRDFEEAKARGIRVIDATCQLVTKVHREVGYYAARGYFIIFIGHRGHVEQIGTFGQVDPTQIALVETEEDAWLISPPQTQKLVVATQTTLPVNYTRRIIYEVLRVRFANLLIPSVADICYATSNRQEAVEALAKYVDRMFVVGSPESANSQSLRRAAELAGARAHLIDTKRDLEPAWLESVTSVGLTSGASTPDTLVEEVVGRLRELGAGEIRVFSAHDEKVEPFPLPKELVQLMKERGVSREALADKLISRAWRPSIATGQPTL